ncbi:hemolysin family protein [Egicoccus halophilus]|uniref:Membrane protein n=1 Tax=Egicoccus halophilus TaxID=1670830 RepID=A0A8J3EW02_9ACTN|nr:hemolysin family protein [Egicoccus halophilus]GGI09245.1 membrane protein [Egicoccus halophilus]
MTLSLPLVVTGIVLLVLTAASAAVETVVDRLNVVRALRLREEERRGAPALLWLTEHRATSLSVLLAVGLTLRVALGAVAGLVGWQLDAGPGAAVAVAVAVVATLVLGEVAPRTVVLRHLETAGLRLAGPARVLVRVLDPVARGVVTLGRALVPRRHEVSGPYATDDELRQLDADEEEQDDELEPEERAMIRSIFELADTIVREIMVPRPDMVLVAEDAALHDVVQVVLERGYSRVPVHAADDVDTVVGVVYAKDLLRRVATEQRRERWGDLVRRPTFVPETKRCDELLRELQEATVHLAIVVDEYGETVGLVTIEDILEEIVGEIVDEHDHEEPLVELLDDEVLRVDARLGVDDLNELLDAALPEEGWDSVGGLVFGTLGRVPVEGEQLELEGLCITVERVQGRRVGKVLVARRPPVEDEAAESVGS